MKHYNVYQEAEIIKKDIHYYNFVRSIIRLFSVPFRNSVTEIDQYLILDICGFGGNGLVFRVIRRADRLQYALKIPYLSHYMIDLFHLTREHMHDDPLPKIDEIADYFADIHYEIQVHPHLIRDDFKSMGEERSYNREFYALRAMNGSENIVHLCDYGSFDLFERQQNRSIMKRRMTYYVMPLFQGTPLPEYIRTLIPSEEKWLKTMELFGKIIDLVDLVHQNGVIHRDLHPNNFIFDETTGEMHLIDLGSAFMDTDRPIDIPGEKRGTNRLMSPEQFRDARNVDARSDYYYLGGLLFYMLTFRTLFTRERTRRTTPLSPSDFLTKSIFPSEQIGDYVLMFIERLLQDERELRYQTIEEIRKDWDTIVRLSG